MSEDEEAVKWWVDHALLLYIVLVLATKAVLLRRESRLGAALAVNSGTFALVYLGAFLATWVPQVFASVWWMWFIRAAVAVSVTGVVVEFRRAFGSWGALFAEVRHGLRLHNGLREPPERGDRDG